MSRVFQLWTYTRPGFPRKIQTRLACPFEARETEIKEVEDGEVQGVEEGEVGGGIETCKAILRLWGK